MSGIRFERVWKFFEGSAVVSDLSLDVRAGEFIVLVGPSGCGKTTSLRMLAGLERPSHGRIFIDDRDVTDVPTGERDISMVFQSYALYPNMNVYRNLAFGPRVRKEPRATLDSRINEVAELLQIKHLLKRTPAALSGGQRQRVALGRALIREPQVFLMDEPLSNLDAALRVQMRAELIRLHQRLEKTTTVYVTHDQVEALTMGDRVAVLKDGVLLQVDSANDLYEHPSSVFVGEFIGSPKMNVVDGDLSHSGGSWTLEILGARMDVTERVAGCLREGVSSGPVLVGIRPHDLQPATGAPGEGPRFSASVDISEHTGAEVFATMNLGSSRVVARLPRVPAPGRGDRVDLVLRSGTVHLFDRDTQVSLLDRDTRSRRASAIADSSQQVR